MRRSILATTTLVLLIACTPINNSINNVLIVGSIRGPFYLHHTYVINSDGKELKADLPFKSSSQAEWSRNHRWAAVATDNPNKSQIIIIDLEKNAQIHLTDYKDGESYAPTWAPDGNRIAYFSYDAGGDQDGIYVTDIFCLRENLTCNLVPKFLINGSSPSWSSDGQRIVFESTDHQIAILDVDQARDPITIISDRNCNDPKWSPVEEKIVVSCFEEDSIDIFTVNVDGSGLTNLTKAQGTNTMPIWSPNGQKIAFISDRDTKGTMLGFNDTVRANSVYIMNSDGSNIKRMTIRNDESIRWLTWVYP